MLQQQIIMLTRLSHLVSLKSYDCTICSFSVFFNCFYANASKLISVLFFCCNSLSKIFSFKCRQVKLIIVHFQAPGLNKSLPVLLVIHGGAFADGHSNFFGVGPQYLMEGGMVMVGLNYRLGAFGKHRFHIKTITPIF